MSGFLYLTDADLDGLGITTAAIADAIEAVIKDKAEGWFFDSPKAAILPGQGRYMMSTLAVGNGADLTVLKAVSVNPDNNARGLASINGAILVLDAQTGLMRAVMDASWITGIRTAALSTVAARRLADPASSSVAFVGCGVQAHSHLEAFSELFPLTEIRAFGRGKANVDRLCAAAEAKGLRATAAPDAESALRGADLIVTSVSLDYSIKPFLDAGWMKPGAFAAITDLSIPWHRETMGAFAPVVVDDAPQEAAMEKKMIDPALIAADLTQMISGQVAVERDPARPSAFVFRGIAIGDFAATALALEKAEAQVVGQRIQ